MDTILLDALARTGLNPYFKYSSVGGLPVREWNDRLLKRKGPNTIGASSMALFPRNKEGAVQRLMDTATFSIAHAHGMDILPAMNKKAGFYGPERPICREDVYRLHCLPYLRGKGRGWVLPGYADRFGRPSVRKQRTRVMCSRGTVLSP